MTMTMPSQDTQPGTDDEPEESTQRPFGCRFGCDDGTGDGYGCDGACVGG
jgi:hypothetical protein